MKVVSRGKGASAVAKAAYISGEKIKNKYDNITHDYRKKKEIVHKEILLPYNAPPKLKKRTVLWNTVESAETRKNSQTARHIDAALPVEISRHDQIDMVRNFCQQCFITRGMCVDFAIHDKNDGNPHVHILLTTRRVDKNGFTTKDRSWNDKSLLLEWRKLWADWCNHKLYFVSNDRIDHRSYKDQGIDRIPQVHLGTAVCAIEKKGYRTDKGSRNRKIQLMNLDFDIEKTKSEILSFKDSVQNLKQEMIETMVGCPFSNMLMFTFDADYMNAFESALQKNNIPCARLDIGNGENRIIFNSNDNEKIEQMKNYFDNIGCTIPNIKGRDITWSERIAEFERRQLLAEKEKQSITNPKLKVDKPVKKRRSR